MKRIITLLFGSCLLLFAACTCFAQMYTVMDLGTLGGMTRALSVNNSGEVVGLAGLYDDQDGRGFRTAPNSPINPFTDDLGRVRVNGIFTWAYGINASGQVVGTELDCCYSTHAFRTAPNSPINPLTDDLGVPGGYAYGINDNGQVVGYFSPSSTTSHAFRTAPNSPFNPLTDDLGTLGGTASYAANINGVGQVVGYSSIVGNTSQHAFRTAPNSPINPLTDDLGTLGGAYSFAGNINGAGQVVGSSNINGNTAVGHAFRTAPNSPINPLTDDLGTLGGTYAFAESINAYGQVVGFSFTSGDAAQHAFLYDGGAPHDLNDLIPAGFDPLIWALSINDLGQIVVGNSERSFLLTPIYKGVVQQPINADGSSVFSAKRGVIPVKFAVTQYGTQPSCTLPATIGIVKAGNGTLAAVDENTYSMSADGGSNFKIDPTACQYIYNLAASALGVGTYRVDISINGIMVGHAVFALR